MKWSSIAFLVLAPACPVFSQPYSYTGQAIFTSQSFNSPLNNPALCGSGYGSSVYGTYQYLPYNHQHAFYSAADIGKIQWMNAGIMVTRQFSDITQYDATSVRLNYNYRYRITRNTTIRAGVYGNLSTQNNYSTWTQNPYAFTEEIFLPVENKKQWLDAGLGLLFLTRSAYAGISLNHIIQKTLYNNENTQPLPLFLETQLFYTINLGCRYTTWSVPVSFSLHTKNQLNRNEVSAGPKRVVTVAIQGVLFDKLLLGPVITYLDNTSLAGAKIGCNYIGGFCFYYQYQVGKIQGEIKPETHEIGVNYKFVNRKRIRHGWGGAVNIPFVGSSNHHIFCRNKNKYVFPE
jgi:hypothetical protein